jgi:hypothetical protein
MAKDVSRYEKTSPLKKVALYPTRQVILGEGELEKLQQGGLQ